MTQILPGSIALRAFPRRVRRAKSAHEPRSGIETIAWPRSVLIFDTETSVDAAQALLFGSYNYCRWQGEKLECLEEGLFYADELPAQAPKEFSVLVCYANSERADAIAKGIKPLRFLSRRDFIEEVFYPAAYDAGALVVGFNLPFDLTRIGVSVGE